MEKAILYRRKNHKVLIPGECSSWGIYNLMRFLSEDVKADIDSFRERFQDEERHQRSFHFQNTDVDREGDLLRLQFAYDDENPQAPYFELSIEQLRFIFDKWEEAINKQVDKIIITKNKNDEMLVEFLEGVWTEYIVMVFYDLRGTYVPAVYSSDDIYNLGRFLFNDVGHSAHEYKAKINAANWDLIKFEFSYLKKQDEQISIYPLLTYHNDSDCPIFALSLKQMLYILDKWQEAIAAGVDQFVVIKNNDTCDISVEYKKDDYNVTSMRIR